MKIFFAFILCLFCYAFVAAATVPDLDQDGVADALDVCPWYHNPEQRFSGIVGCGDGDGDGFEDLFFDRCRGYYGSNQGCPQEQYMQLLAVGGELPGVTLQDACILPNTLVAEGDYIMLQLDTGSSDTILSDPIRIE